jgi:hypothetical protein
MVWIITDLEEICQIFISYPCKERYCIKLLRNQYILLENRAVHMYCLMRLPAGQWTILSSWRNQG